MSLAFVEDWLASLKSHCSPQIYADCLGRSGFSPDLFRQRNVRVTHDQIVALYRHVAVSTGDEMMGLWSRPIRSGALKYICTVVLEASSMRTALFRFVQFWNLLLDDYRLELVVDETYVAIRLLPRMPNQRIHRFGHMLLLKLAHGMFSWLAGRELPLRHVVFSFPRPAFAEDYPVIFPASIGFGEAFSAIFFERSVEDMPLERRIVDMRSFLERAPRDWIFTKFNEHALQLRVREIIYASQMMDCRLEQVANTLNFLLPGP
ncbi:MAG: AraC family transcriptional regulator ligand-binding domain-containing protein [Polyangiaceae bacterium]